MTNLRKIREHLDLNQDEMAEVLHVSRSMVAKMESGKHEMTARTTSILVNFLRERDLTLTDDGDIIPIVHEKDQNQKILHLQEQLIESQTVQIKNLESMIGDKLILLEAYAKAGMVELVRMSSKVHGHSESEGSKRMAEVLRAELQKIQQDTVRYYSSGKGL